MIVLDTSVLSEFSKPSPNQRVIAWIDRHSDQDLLITAITVAELRAAVAAIAETAARIQMQKIVDQTLHEFGAMCLAFDGIAAEEYATILAARQAAGRPIGVRNAQVAAIARSSGLVLATLNVREFEGIDGLRVIDPSA